MLEGHFYRIEVSEEAFDRDNEVYDFPSPMVIVSAKVCCFIGYVIGVKMPRDRRSCSISSMACLSPLRPKATCGI